MGEPADIRCQIFRDHRTRFITACLVAETPGLLSGLERSRVLMEGLGLYFSSDRQDGDLLSAGQKIIQVSGSPLQIIQAEERIIGTLSKSSGIATAADQARRAVGTRCQVVSGGWKKMPWEIKELVRQAIRDGGMNSSILKGPFIYLDKNYIRILGGVGKAVQTVISLGRAVVVQVRGELRPIEEEALEAAQAGAAAVMVDTGRRDHLTQVGRSLEESGFRSRVKIAFAGNVLLSHLESLAQNDVDIIDIGYAILDAPCLPMCFDVIQVE